MTEEGVCGAAAAAVSKQLSCNCKVTRCEVCKECSRCGCEHDGRSISEKLKRRRGRPRQGGARLRCRCRVRRCQGCAKCMQCSCQCRRVTSRSGGTKGARSRRERVTACSEAESSEVIQKVKDKYPQIPEPTERQLLSFLNNYRKKRRRERE